jgi:hypothetical protein
LLTMEGFSLAYISLDETALRSIGYVIFIFGGLVAGQTVDARAGLSRTPYFVFCSAQFLMLGAVQIIWLGAAQAVEGGYLWALVAIDTLTRLGVGYSAGWSAMARSQDGWLTPKNAWMAFVPFANLALLFKSSVYPNSPSQMPVIRLARGWLGIVIGVAMLFVYVTISATVKEELARQDKVAAAQTPEEWVEKSIRSTGLEATLRKLAADQKPTKVDSATTMTRIEAEGTQLRRTYVVTGTISALSDEMKSEIAAWICAHPPFVKLLRAGGSLKEVYVRTDGSQIGAQLVTGALCRLQWAGSHRDS